MKTRARMPLALAAIVSATLLALAPMTPAAADTVTESVPVSSQTQVLAATPDGSKVVIVSLSSTVSVLDVATGVESTPVSLNTFAYNVVISPDGATAIVPTSDGNLFFVDTATAAVSAPVSIGSYAFDIAFSLDGSLAYVSTGGASIAIVTMATRTLTGTVAVGGSLQGYGIALALDGASLFVTDIFVGIVVEVAVATGAIVDTFPAGSFPSEVVEHSDGRLYIGSFIFSSVGVIDPVLNTYSPIGLLTVGPVSAIALTPDGSRLYVPRGFGNQVAIIDTATNVQTDAAVTGVDVRGIAITADGTTAFTGDVSSPAVLVIAIDRPPLLATTAPAATIATAYTFAAGIGGSPAPAFALTGSLPAGLSFDTATGVVSGTPTALGTSSFSITATNALATVSQAYSITVAAAAVLPAAGPSPAPVFALAVGLLGLGLLVRRQFAQATSGTRK